MSEESLIETRRAKHIKINGGCYPIFNQDRTNIRYALRMFDDLNIIKATIDPSELTAESIYTLTGRITLFRKGGGISFAKLTDDTGSIQLLFSKNILPDYKDLSLLDLGDIIAATGYLILSKTEEKSLFVTGYTVITKSIRPPPEKFAGLSDTETKYRKRYVDLMSSEDSRSMFIIRSQVIKGIRRIMERRDFMEVETPTLTTVNSGANAKPFTTHHNSLGTDLYMRIAPELYLKRLLVGGFNKIYELGKSFRNEGLSTRHNPEFTMMETYEAYGSFNALQNQTMNLIRDIDIALNMYLPNVNESASKFYSVCQSLRDFSLTHIKSIKMVDAVNYAMMMASLTATDDYSNIFTICNPRNNRLPLIDLNDLRYELDRCSSVGQRIGVLFENLAEPFLTFDYRTEDGKLSCPVFITDYPSQLCPLARPQDNNPNFCDRFELFIDGRELCNAYQELNDPVIQAEQFQNQLILNDKDPMDYDFDYIEALEYGMPPAVGFGIGIDRLVMLLTGATSIKDVILFPTLKQQNNG
jgi:lysyl-tRNA synthetase class 2